MVPFVLITSLALALFTYLGFRSVNHENLRRSSGNDSPEIHQGYLDSAFQTGPYKSVDVDGRPAVIEYNGVPILDHLKKEGGLERKSNRE